MNTITQIENIEIAQTIVRTAYSRLYDCLLILKDQNESLSEVKISEPATKRLVNMLVQDFSCAHNPSNGSSPLRHAQPSDKERDLEVATRFNELPPPIKQALAKSALIEMVGNFNQSPIAQGLRFKL